MKHLRSWAVLQTVTDERTFHSPLTNMYNNSRQIRSACHQTQSTEKTYAPHKDSSSILTPLCKWVKVKYSAFMSRAGPSPSRAKNLSAVTRTLRGGSTGKHSRLWPFSLIQCAICLQACETYRTPFKMWLFYVTEHKSSGRYKVLKLGKYNLRWTTTNYSVSLFI